VLLLFKVVNRKAGLASRQGGADAPSFLTGRERGLNADSNDEAAQLQWLQKPIDPAGCFVQHRVAL